MLTIEGARCSSFPRDDFLPSWTVGPVAWTNSRPPPFPRRDARRQLRGRRGRSPPTLSPTKAGRPTHRAIDLQARRGPPHRAIDPSPTVGLRRSRRPPCAAPTTGSRRDVLAAQLQRVLGRPDRPEIRPPRPLYIPPPLPPAVVGSRTAHRCRPTGGVGKVHYGARGQLASCTRS